MAEEARILAEQTEAQNKIYAEYEAYGIWLCDWLPELLANLELVYVKKLQGENKHKREIERTVFMEVDEWHYDVSGFYFWMKTLPLPPSVKINMIMDETVAATLQVNLGRRVEIEYNKVPERPGLWIVVWHNEPLNKIPKHVKWPALYAKLPGNTRFEVPVGLGLGHKFHWLDMLEAKNLLIGGTTGFGKSIMINGLLCSLLSQNSPNELRLFLVDLKEGVEFTPYDGIPHLGGDMRFTRNEESGEIEIVDNDHVKTAKPPLFAGKIIYREEMVEIILDYFQAEIRRRGELFRHRGIRNVAHWNEKFPNEKMAVWLIVWDEFAQILRLLSSKVANRCMQKVSSVGEKGRAFGLGQVICTQYPDGDVMPGSIKANFPYTIAFYCKYPYQSQALLNNRDAHNLLSAHAGEAIFDDGKRQMIVQTGFLSDFTNKQIIANVKGGKINPDKGKVVAYKIDPGEIWNYALESLGGFCNVRELIKRFSPTHEVHKILKDFEAKLDSNEAELLPKPVIQLESDYILLPSAGNTMPRKLIKLSEFIANRTNYLPCFAIRDSRFAKSNGVTKPISVEQPAAPVLAVA